MKENFFFLSGGKKKSKSAKNKFFFKLFRDVPDVKLIVEKLCQPRVYMKPSGTASILHFGLYGPNRGDRLRVKVWRLSVSMVMKLSGTWTV